MSDAPNRTIAGLAPRATPDLSRMQARNRPSQPAEAPEQAKPSAKAPTPQKQGAARQRRSTPKQAPAPAVPSDRVNAYVSPSVHERAKATFKATRHLEGDTSWSEFVERAILAETQRREAQHNAGESYPSDGTRLPAGRPLK